MPTLFSDPLPQELQALIERRQRLGQDLFDEVRDGVLHMNPLPGARPRAAPRLRGPRLVPPTAALVVEIVSPGDDSYRKFDFYAAHGVDEAVIVDPSERAVHWYALAGGEYRDAERSAVIDAGTSKLPGRIDWP